MQSAGETATMVADQTKYAGRTVADYVRTHPVQMALRGRRHHLVAAARQRSVRRLGRRVGRLAGQPPIRHRLRHRLRVWRATARCARRSASTPRRPAKRWAGTPPARVETVSEAAEAARCQALKASERVSGAAYAASERVQQRGADRVGARAGNVAERQHVGGRLGARISARGRRHCRGRRRRDRPLGAGHRDRGPHPGRDARSGDRDGRRSPPGKSKTT